MFATLPREEEPDYAALDAPTCRAMLLRHVGGRVPCRRFTSGTAIAPVAHNIVSTVHIRTNLAKINLEAIAQCLANSVYDKKRFAAITLRIEEPRITALLFSSGKLVITGSLSRQMAKRATRNIVQLLRDTKMYRFVTHSGHVIQNIVCNVRLPPAVSIDIDALYREENTQCTYQPAIFPGLILRAHGSPVVLLVFKSSRIVVTGAQTYADVRTGFEMALRTLQPYFRTAA